MSETSSLFLKLMYKWIKEVIDKSMNYGIVEYFGKDSGHSCGYCKQSDTSVSHGKNDFLVLSANLALEVCKRCQNTSSLYSWNSQNFFLIQACGLIRCDVKIIKIWSIEVGGGTHYVHLVGFAIAEVFNLNVSAKKWFPI